MFRFSKNIRDTEKQDLTESDKIILSDNIKIIMVNVLSFTLALGFNQLFVSLFQSFQNTSKYKDEPFLIRLAYVFPLGQLLYVCIMFVVLLAYTNYIKKTLE